MNWKNMFFESDGKDKKAKEEIAEPTKEVQAPAPTSNGTTAQSHTSTMAAMEPQGIVGGIDEGVAGKLDAALKARSKGTALEKFMQNLLAMKDAVPDETRRFKAALATLSPQGLSPQDVIEAVDSQFDTLVREQEIFDNVLEGQSRRLVEIDNEMAHADENIADKLEQIALLQETVQQLEESKERLRSDQDQERTRIERARANFAATHNSFIKKVTDFKERLVSHTTM